MEQIVLFKLGMNTECPADSLAPCDRITLKRIRHIRESSRLAVNEVLRRCLPLVASPVFNKQERAAFLFLTRLVLPSTFRQAGWQLWVSENRFHY